VGPTLSPFSTASWAFRATDPLRRLEELANAHACPCGSERWTGCGSQPAPAIQWPRENPRVADDKGLEEEPRPIQVVQQPLGTAVLSGHSQRRIDLATLQPAGCTCSDPHFVPPRGGNSARNAIRSRPNTVQLGLHDGVVGRVVWLGPGRVVGAFDVPLGHLALDDSGGGACSSGWVEPVEETVQESEPPRAVTVVGVAAVRGERRPAGRWSGG
jgi:hypothetical protein